MIANKLKQKRVKECIFKIMQQKKIFLFGRFREKLINWTHKVENENKRKKLISA